MPRSQECPGRFSQSGSRLRLESRRYAIFRVAPYHSRGSAPQRRIKSDGSSVSKRLRFGCSLQPRLQGAFRLRAERGESTAIAVKFVKGGAAMARANVWRACPHHQSAAWRVRLEALARVAEWLGQMVSAPGSFHLIRCRLTSARQIDALRRANSRGRLPCQPASKSSGSSPSYSSLASPLEILVCCRLVIKIILVGSATRTIGEDG